MLVPEVSAESCSEPGSSRFVMITLSELREAESASARSASASAIPTDPEPSVHVTA